MGYRMKFTPSRTKDSLPPKVFISYSHNDREFVERLAKNLAEKQVLVWWDEWEIKVGDSLVQKIQQGISSSSYLAVVLSPNSINSPWVQEELNAALIQQLNEQRVFVIPILLADCQIPPFLQDKKYADFRVEFNSGLEILLEALKPSDLQIHGRSSNGDYLHDYAFEWGKFKSLHGLKVYITSHSTRIEYSVTCVVIVVANDRYSRRLDQLQESGFEWDPRALLLMFAQDMSDQINPVILIDSDIECVESNFLVDSDHDIGINLEIRVRRIGQDPGSDILYDWRNVFTLVSEKHREGIRNGLSDTEYEKFSQWLQDTPL